MLLRDKPWDKNLQLLLASVVAFNLVPHMTTVPLWITLIACGSIAWKALYLTRGWPLPNRWFVSAAGVVSALIVYFTHSTLLGQEASGALLVLMASLKLLETNRYRDAMLVVFTSYFLLMAYLIDSQSLVASAYMILDLGLLTTLLLKIHQRDQLGLWQPTFRLLAMTFPLWLFLFFAFPRFSTGFGGPSRASGGTGFSDSLDPGSIERLLESDEIAFRVRFTAANEGQVLSPSTFYYRGAILSEGHGLKWTRARGSLRSDILYGETPPNPVEAEVWLEPSGDRWLFALDFPVAFRSNDVALLQQVRKQFGFTYRTSQPVFSRTSYVTRSSIEAPRQTMTKSDLERFLDTPEELSDRFQELTRSLAATVDSRRSNGRREERLARRVLEWFGEERFRYTRSPGTMKATDGVAQLDEFLFERKLGFCEHYSAALATMMRAMGVPARVIVGFQGGNPNDLGSYWIVRRLDAHAWTEIFVSDPHEPTRGQWKRIDPTEVIAPLRLQLGGDYYRLDPSGLAANVSGDELRRQLSGGWLGSIRQAGLAWDIIQMRWNAFLLSYDFNQQAELLSALGVSFDANFRWILFVFTSIGAAAFAMAIVFILRRLARREDPVLAEWRRFCVLIERRGLTRANNEATLDFADRARRQFPSEGGKISEIAEMYAEIRYGAPGSRPLSGFKRAIRNFKFDAQSGQDRR